jgi:ABC-type transporter Mla subunit MlaD
MRRKLALTAATFVMLSASLVACGEDAPAVCGSAEQLQSSVDKLKDIDVRETNGLDEFKSQLETIDGDLDQLTNDAKSEFSSQVDAVTTTFEALMASVQGATADPSAATLSAAATALSAFSTDVQAFVSDVQSTC